MGRDRSGSQQEQSKLAQQLGLAQEQVRYLVITLPLLPLTSTYCHLLLFTTTYYCWPLPTDCLLLTAHYLL